MNNLRIFRSFIAELVSIIIDDPSKEQYCRDGKAVLGFSYCILDEVTTEQADDSKSKSILRISSFVSCNH